MNELIIIVAKYGLIVPIVLALYIFITLHSRSERVEFLILGIGGGLLSLTMAKIASHYIIDPRPFVVGHFLPLFPHANDNGFPSDHTLLASLLGFMLLRYSKVLALIALLAAAGIGLARVAAGVHHLEDILGSFVITAAATLTMLGILHYAKTRKENA